MSTPDILILIASNIFMMWFTYGVANYISGRFGEYIDLYESGPEVLPWIIVWPIYYIVTVGYFLFTNKVTVFVLENIVDFGTNMKHLGRKNRKK